MSVDGDPRPDRAVITAEAPLPQTITEHGDLVAPVIGGRDQSAACGGRTEHVEVVAGHQFAFNPLGFTACAQVKSRRRGDRQAGHRRIGCAIVEIVRVTQIADIALLRVLPAHLHEPIRFGNAAERPQQQRVQDAEDRGIRTNAECQRKDGDQRERRCLQQHPDAESKVLHHFVLSPSHHAPFFLGAPRQHST